MPRLSRATVMASASLLLVLLLGAPAEARGGGRRSKPKAKPAREVFLRLTGVT